MSYKEIYFIRHPHISQWNFNSLTGQDANKYFFDKGLIAVAFNGGESWNPDDYSGQGKSAIKYMNKCNELGSECHIFAAYRIEGKIRILSGTPKVGSKCFLREHFGKPNVSAIKLLKLKPYEEIALEQFPFPFVLPPGRQTFVHWRNCEAIANRFLNGEEPDELMPASYLPDALEIVCEEYLREMGLLKASLFKRGGQLRDYDIVGIDGNDRVILAQVKHKTSRQQWSRFSGLARQGDGKKFHYFTGEMPSLRNQDVPENVKVIQIGEVINRLVRSKDYGRGYLKRLVSHRL